MEHAEYLIRSRHVRRQWNSEMFTVKRSLSYCKRRRKKAVSLRWRLLNYERVMAVLKFRDIDAVGRLPETRPALTRTEILRTPVTYYSRHGFQSTGSRLAGRLPWKNRYAEDRTTVGQVDTLTARSHDSASRSRKLQLAFVPACSGIDAG